MIKMTAVRPVLAGLLHIGIALMISGCGVEEVELTPPQQLTGSPFHYPEELWDAEVQGETVLRLFVNQQGAVDTVQVERASGYESFDSAAVRGARDLRFQPAVRGEEPVSVWVLLPVRFDLPDSVADTVVADQP
jgi:periplasmic protein TonB